MSTTYFIFEKFSQTTLKGSNQLRSTDGYEAISTVEAESETEALGKWLLDKQDAYDIIKADDVDAEFESRKQNAWYECASERLVWEPGDTSADFGDFSVRAFTETEVTDGGSLEKAAIKAGLIENPEEK